MGRNCFPMCLGCAYKDIHNKSEPVGALDNPLTPKDLHGSGGRDRTADKRIMIPLLYQLSYAAMWANCSR